MQSQPTPGASRPPRPASWSSTASGCAIRVERGRLVLADGIGRHRRAGQFAARGSGLRRLIVLGTTGFASALPPCAGSRTSGVGVLQLDTDGRVLAASAGLGRDDPRMRRAQARAIDTPIGDDIARRLIAEKLAAQSDTLAAVDRVAPVGGDVVATLADAGRRLHVATSRDEVRTAEGMAAAAYWSGWSAVPVRFARSDAARVPESWLRVRRADLTAHVEPPPRGVSSAGHPELPLQHPGGGGSPRVPRRSGLDPGLGVLHADLNARDSLALDVMEPIRPLVDRYVLGLLTERPFRAADFHETRQGVVRVLAPLSHELAATALTWRAHLGPVAERVAALLLAGEGAAVPTPISGRNRSLGRGRPGGTAAARAATPRDGLPLLRRGPGDGAAHLRRLRARGRVGREPAGGGGRPREAHRPAREGRAAGAHACGQPGARAEGVRAATSSRELGRTSYSRSRGLPAGNPPRAAILVGEGDRGRGRDRQHVREPHPSGLAGAAPAAVAGAGQRWDLQ